ncbi:MAG: ribonucrease [Patescibacteria group bacterium]|nr:ribonucrease [Patescibacteria group bacterium]
MQLELILPIITSLGAVALAYYLFTRKTAQGGKVDIETSEKAQSILLNAKDEAIKIKEKAEIAAREIRNKSLETEKKAERRFDDLYHKIKEVDERDKQVGILIEKWKRKNSQVEEARTEQLKKLEEVAGLPKEEAKRIVMNRVEQDLESDIAKRVKNAEEAIQAEVAVKSKELLVDAMHHASTDYVAEYTITTVKLADPDVKGRIIGKEGRNIKAFEDITGVNVDFENEDEVRLSSFDSVRREVARISLEQLIKDGRIHPARIEEIVRKVNNEMDRVIFEAGTELCQKVGVFNLPKDLVKKLGNFKYRTSYGQNMIQHTLEETKIGVKLAHEVGADVPITKLACLLHDIGKVVTDKEGNHIELAVDYLRRFNIPQAVLTAVAEHHEDKPSSVEGVLVQIADSISGSRPGARYEDYENYIRRMRDLEDAAMAFEGVEKVFAISAGRELRVVVNANVVNDAGAVKLSNDIAKKIEDEQTFPGTVKVIVIRELRATATAS